MYIARAVMAVGVCMLIVAVNAQASAQSGAPGDEQSQIAGVWRGNSVCTVKNSPCHDEVNVYHISEIAGRPGWFFVSADKIVNGREVVMGTGDWKYEKEAHALIYDFERGTFRLNIGDGKMEGDLKLKDGTVYRLIHLQKEK